MQGSLGATSRFGLLLQPRRRSAIKSSSLALHPCLSARAHMLALLAPLPAALALPDAPHSSAEWKIAAYSSAAPAEIAAGATAPSARLCSARC